MSQTELPTTYDPAGIEDKWYKAWTEAGSFKPVRNDFNKTYTILMPPPNVTGRLHMGHALDQTAQDTLIRYKRMKGFETLWIPGSDHAGIATQAKVEEKIFKEDGLTKHDLGKEKFLDKVWEWKEEYGGHILEQLKRLGISCDWDYFTFTMDEGPNKSVNKVFADLYNEGLIYQSEYIINWDPQLQSAISDAEVDHKEVNGNFYHIHYRVKDSNKVLEVATTRPETLFGDTAVAVNPNDDRFEDLIGKTVIIPICNREVKIIADTYVDMDKGTGCLKVTPGHDFNDFEIGKRHNLEIINILNKDGTMNNLVPESMQGLPTKRARKETVKLLEAEGLLLKTESHTHQVGHSQRSGEIVEPMVSMQWFLNSDSMAKVSVDEVDNKNMQFYPDGWKNTYYSYQKNPRPWCISRQLWWGHKIPVYYCQDDSCKNTWAAETDPENCPKCNKNSFQQDPDVLDTWFSSALFPLSTLGWPDPEKMKEKGFERFYPTQTLVTGYDIIFFWVARMMMMCNKVTGESPFSDVYIHALVRDKDGVKMSKSLGNVIDPLDIINESGCDALRFTLMANSGYNRNINLDPAIIEGYRNFINKLWNAFRFIQPFLSSASNDLPELDKLTHHEKWILSELNEVTTTMNESMDEYRFDDSCNAIYQFVYDRYCSWFIEVSKSILHGPNVEYKNQRAAVLKYGFRQIMKLLHPYIPFITEELWAHLKEADESMLISQDYPQFEERFQFVSDQEKMSKFIELTTAVRNLRASVNIKPKEEIEVKLFTDDEELASYFYKNRIYFKELANVVAGDIKDKKSDRPDKSIMQATPHTEVFIPLEGLIDMQDQVNRIKKDIDKAQKEFDKLDKKLNNSKFLENAPADVVEEVKVKANDFQEKLKSLNLSLENFQ